MALQPILDMLCLLVEEAEPTGQVHAYDRIAVEPEQGEAVIGVTDTTFSKGWAVRVWMLDRTRSEEVWETNSENVCRHYLRLQGYWEVNDSAGSREDFRDAVEAIRGIWRNLPFAGPNVAITGIPSGLQATLPEMELLGPPQVEQDGLSVLGETLLCHSVQITVVVQERILRVPLT